MHECEARYCVILAMEYIRGVRPCYEPCGPILLPPLRAAAPQLPASTKTPRMSESSLSTVCASAVPALLVATASALYRKGRKTNKGSSCAPATPVAMKAGIAIAELDRGVEEVRFAVGSEAATFGSMRKELHFVRHAESTQNQAASKFSRDDPRRKDVCMSDDFFDAPLSEEGHTQCTNFRRSDTAAGLQNVDLVLTSPLTRALQTATETFPVVGSQTTPRFVVVESLREFNSSAPHPSDWRRMRCDLEPEFPDVDFAVMSPGMDMILGPRLVEDPSLCDARLMWLLVWLKRQPESEVVCVTHGALAKRCFNNIFKPAGYDLEFDGIGNLEVRSVPIAFE